MDRFASVVLLLLLGALIVNALRGNGGAWIKAKFLGR